MGLFSEGPPGIQEQYFEEVIKKDKVKATLVIYHGHLSTVTLKILVNALRMKQRYIENHLKKASPC